MNVIRPAAAAVLAYESAALLSRGKLPTITSLCENRWLAATLVAGLIAHLVTTPAKPSPAAPSLTASAPAMPSHAVP